MIYFKNFTLCEIHNMYEILYVYIFKHNIVFLISNHSNFILDFLYEKLIL